MKTVVVLSGGLDSTTALAQAIRDDEGEVLTVTFHYGQKHEIELSAAQRIADYYKVSWKRIDLPNDVFHSGALAGDTEMPHMTYEELHDAVGPSPTYVPFRNGTMLSLAAAYAITQEAQYIKIGAHAEDARNWAYPDCRPEFMVYMGKAIEVGSYFQVNLQVPFQYMSKAQVVELGAGLDVPFEKTWSCYDPVWTFGEGEDYSHPVHCGQCPTCIGRKAAFESLGLTDPVEYAKVEA